MSIRCSSIQYPIGAFCNTYDLHQGMIGLKTNLGLFESGRLTRVSLGLSSLFSSEKKMYM